VLSGVFLCKAVKMRGGSIVVALFSVLRGGNATIDGFVVPVCCDQMKGRTL
jgi:hypothetical protein